MADDEKTKSKWERVKDAKKKIDGAQGKINTGAKVITDIIHGESFGKIVENFADGIGFGGVVGLFKAIFGLDKETEPEDPMRKDVDQLMEDMKEVKKSLSRLNEQVKQLSGLVSDGFNDMKAFITEQAFYLQVALSVDRLGSFLQDMLNDPSDNNTRDFLDECGKGSPRGHAYTILGLLKNDATNPLKMAMVGDTMRTRETFGKWKNVIKEVLGHLLFLDYIYDGLREQQKTKTSLYAPDDFRLRLVELDPVFDEWAKEFGTSYWPQVARKVGEEAMKANKGKSREDVAAVVKAGLEKILTDDSFYFIIADDPYRDYTWNEWSKRQPDHYLPVVGDGRSVLIYRSVTARDRTQADVDKLRPYMDDIGRRFDAVDDPLINVDFFISEKFTVAWANSQFQWRPGWWVTKKIDSQDWTWIIGFK